MLLWYLEVVLKDEGAVQRLPLLPFPFIIGREDNLPLTIPKPSISRKHLRLDQRDHGLVVTDLKSRNGTYLNRNRIDRPTVLQHGDILHIGDVEMRLIQSEAEDEPEDDTTMTIDVDFMAHFPLGIKELEELLQHESVMPVFQPIVDSENRVVYGYELLGRGSGEADLTEPKTLFQIAESVGREVALSELMRRKGIEQAAQNRLPGRLFVNTHPRELQHIDDLLRSVREARQSFSSTRLVLEIHEQAITDLDTIRDLKNELRSMDVLLAYDDFGAGQSRLLELSEAVPDILKFDMMFIHSIDQARRGRRELLQQLNRFSKRLGIRTVAECVDQQAEYDACRSIGFDFYQGYLFGEPRPIGAFATQPP